MNSDDEKRPPPKEIVYKEYLDRINHFEMVIDWRDRIKDYAPDVK